MTLAIFEKTQTAERVQRGRTAAGGGRAAGRCTLGCMMRNRVFSALMLAAAGAWTAAAGAQQQTPLPQPEATEIWQPVPAVVIPGETAGAPPSDAIALFDGKNEDEWVSAQDHTPARWTVADGLLTVAKNTGNIETRRHFHDYQLHIEWRIPADIAGSGQGRGNSGVFLASTGPGDAGYELQVLDGYKNPTYVNGMVGSIYKQSIPLVNAARRPGEWQTYDVVWRTPRFNADGSLKTPAYVTVFLNGVLVEDHFQLKGQTLYRGQPFYQAFDGAAIKLQAHGDKSAPISFRNIWVRELP